MDFTATIQGKSICEGRRSNIPAPGTRSRTASHGAPAFHADTGLHGPGNLILGTEPVKGLSIDVARSERELSEISKKYGMDVNLRACVKDISVGMQQRVEPHLLYRGAEIMIFDEPPPYHSQEIGNSTK